MTNIIGQSLGRYHILEQLGEGGMAIVYKAYDTRLEREVAVKVIRRDQVVPAALERMLKRFEREARALARLSHPNIVKVLDYGEHENAPYLVMEYISGGTLKQKLAGRTVSMQDAVRVLTPIARALAYAHESKIIHRDIKPSNILTTQSGQPMLSDFGIARLLEDETTTELTASGVGVGTPEYMAPEQGQGQADERSDIYALGVVLYEMLTGRRPFTANTPMAVLIKHATEPLPRPSQFIPAFPPPWERVLLKALAKDPDERYQTVDQFLTAMREAAYMPVSSPRTRETSTPDRSRPFAPKTQPVRAVKPVFLWVGLGVICTALCMGVFGWILASQIVIPPVLLPTAANVPTSLPTSTASYTSTVPSVTTPTFTPPIPSTATVPFVPPDTSTPAIVIGRTQISPKDGMTLLFIPGGEFPMGSDNGEDNEKPLHAVFVGDFWMDQTEVTNKMYALCVQDGKCKFTEVPRSKTRGSYYGNPQFDNYPMIEVSWHDATDYCEWAGRRLPTEAEWEKAASWDADKGKKRIYPWGDSIDCTHANYSDKSGSCVGDTAEVGSYPSGASFYGLLDMAGNVWEWVFDLYAAYPGNTIGDSFYGNSLYHVIRGGSWYRGDFSARSATRLRYFHITTADSVGFRCARSTP